MVHWSVCPLVCFLSILLAFTSFKRVLSFPWGVNTGNPCQSLEYLKRPLFLIFCIKIGYHYVKTSLQNMIFWMMPADKIFFALLGCKKNSALPYKACHMNFFGRPLTSVAVKHFPRAVQVLVELNLYIEFCKLNLLRKKLKMHVWRLISLIKLNS